MGLLRWHAIPYIRVWAPFSGKFAVANWQQVQGTRVQQDKVCRLSSVGRATDL